MAELPWLTHVCRGCSAPLLLKNNDYCGRCLQQPPTYQRIVSLFDYQDPIRKFIIGLKFQHKLIYAHLLGQLMVRHLTVTYQHQPLPDVIIPVPLYKKRCRQRGFNQALELACVVSKQLDIPIDYRVIQRIKNTKAQSDLPAKQRPQNVKNAFSVNAHIAAYQHIAIIDDVITTGSTVKAIVAEIKKINAAVRIDIWTVAKV